MLLNVCIWQCAAVVCVCAREKRAQPETLFLTRRRGNYILPTFSSHIFVTHRINVLRLSNFIYTIICYFKHNYIILLLLLLLHVSFSDSVVNKYIIIIIPCSRRNAAYGEQNKSLFDNRNTVYILQNKYYAILRHHRGRKTAAAGCLSSVRCR